MINNKYKKTLITTIFFSIAVLFLFSSEKVFAQFYYDTDGGVMPHTAGRITYETATNTIATDVCVRRGNSYIEEGILTEYHVRSILGRIGSAGQNYGYTNHNCGRRDVRNCDGTYTTRYAVCSTNSLGWGACGGVPGDCVVCTPDNCASNTCIGKTCYNGCNYVDGTKICPINGSCGTRNTTYASTVTAWPIGSTYCAIGTSSPAYPSFPTAGSSVNWTCTGLNGGISASCSASRNAEIIPCSSSNSCASSTCVGNVCYDSCGTSYPGTRNCNWIET